MLSAQLLAALRGIDSGRVTSIKPRLVAQAAVSLPALSSYQPGARKGPQPIITTSLSRCRIFRARDDREGRESTAKKKPHGGGWGRHGKVARRTVAHLFQDGAGVVVDAETVLARPYLMLGDLDWHRFANGDFDEPVRVCRLHPLLVTALGAQDDRLLFHPLVAAKLVFKHRLTPYRLSMLPIVIQFGSAFLDTDGSLVFVYDDNVMTGKLYLAAVKTTGERHEVWLKSFYVVRNKDYERKRQRFTIIRIQQ